MIWYNMVIFGLFYKVLIFVVKSGFLWGEVEYYEGI
jgi:hypothetical protein